jgi:hypothetical protein
MSRRQRVLSIALIHKPPYYVVLNAAVFALFAGIKHSGGYYWIVAAVALVGADYFKRKNVGDNKQFNWGLAPGSFAAAMALELTAIAASIAWIWWGLFVFVIATAATLHGYKVAKLRLNAAGTGS